MASQSANIRDLASEQTFRVSCNPAKRDIIVTCSKPEELTKFLSSNRLSFGLGLGFVLLRLP